MKRKSLFLFLLVTLLVYAGCNKDTPNNQNAIHYLTDTLAGTYVLNGINYESSTDPVSHTTSYNTTTISNDTLVIAKVDQDNLLMSPNGPTYPYNDANSQGSFYCYNTYYAQGSFVSEVDTLWFLKNPLDSIQYRITGQDGPYSRCDYHLSGHKIH